MSDAGRKTLPHTRVTTYATYRVRATVYPSGRKHTFLVPANNAGEAETRARARLKGTAGGGGTGFWREYD